MTAVRAIVDPDLIATLDQLADVALTLSIARRQYADGIRRDDAKLRDGSAHRMGEAKSIIALRAENRGYDPAALIATLEMAGQLRSASKRKPQWHEVERALVREAELLADRAMAARDAALIARHEAAEAAKAADAAARALGLFKRAA